MKHPRNIEGYNSFDELVNELVNNNNAKTFLELLAEDLCRQGDSDHCKGRTNLATKLYQTADKLYESAQLMPIENNYNEIINNIKNLARKVGVMQYDCTAEVISILSEKLACYGLTYIKEDNENNKTGEFFVDASDNLVLAYDKMMNAWDICEKYMNSNN